MPVPLLRVENLSKNFDRLPVLRDVSFSLEHGEVLGLVGRQGAGKSTLFNLLSGALSPSSGTIQFGGVLQPYANRTQAQKLGIEMVYQSAGTIDRWDVRNNLFSDPEKGVETTRRTSGLVEQFDVAHNILLGREPMKVPQLGIIDWDRMVQTAKVLLEEF